MSKPEPVAKIYRHRITGQPSDLVKPWQATDEDLAKHWDLVDVYDQSALDAAINAALEEAAEILFAYRVPVGNSSAGEMASEWTLDALRECHSAIRALKKNTDDVGVLR